MDLAEHSHWIAGRAVPGSSGLGSALHSACEPWESLGGWPLAGSLQLRAALDGLEAGASDWRRRPSAEREGQVARWIRQAVLHASDSLELGRRIGLDAASGWEGSVDMGVLAEDLDSDLAQPRSASGPIAVLACDWSELQAGLLRAVGSLLQAGRAVLILADERTPMCADRVYSDLLAAGLPGDLLAVLHGVDSQGLELLSNDERVGDLWVSSTDPVRMRQWRVWSQNAGIPAARLILLRARSLWLSAHAEVGHAARLALREAFDPLQTLFGQKAGQVGSVYCPSNLFSAFTDALLLELERGGLGECALPLIDAAALEVWSQRWSSGLDQGATLIAGGETFKTRPGARDLRVMPTILTNVEAHMLCAQATLPSPVLCLLRADIVFSSRIEV